MIVKKLNPNAVTVELPDEGEQPYYDNELKVWVFPGEDPAEKAKPIGPPPKVPDASMAAPKAEPAADPNDPLASMMAPPPRITSASKKARPIGAPMRANYGMPPGMVSSQGGAAPPMPANFAVFQPKSSSTKEKQTDDASPDQS